MPAQQEHDTSSGSSGTRLMKGAVILGGAAMISKLLGTLQKIPLQNIAGDEAFGIYNAVYPLYILILFLATAGFPLAVSKFVSERAARGEYQEARRVLHISSMILVVTGLVFFSILFFAAEWIAVLIGNIETKWAVRSVSFALLFVPVMAALRGYFQGLHNMVPTAVSQVIEQWVRVVTMIGLLLLFINLGYPQSWIAAGATFGSVTGAMAGLLAMAYYWWKSPRLPSHRSAAGREHEPTSKLVVKFIYFALPVCLGSIVLPILNLVDTFTMPRLLHKDGLNAMVEFGIYSRGLPIVQLVAMIATSISVVLVPAIAEAKVRNQRELIQVRTESTMRFTWLIGLASSVGLAVAVVPINIMLYKNDSGSLTIAILAFTAVFSTLNIVSSSILLGMGRVFVPARNLLYAALVKVVGNLILIPIWGIEGAALAAVIAFAVASLLNIVTLRSSTGVSFNSAQYLWRPAIALLAMSIALLSVIYGMEGLLTYLVPAIPQRLLYTIVALTAVIGGVLVYMLALFRLGAITDSDLQRIPPIYNKVQPLLTKLRVLR